MAITEYRFDETWHLDAPPEQVWPFIIDLPNYPKWWPQFLEVTRLNDLDGIGALVSVHVRAALPYHMNFDLELVRQIRPRLSEVRCSGDLNGWMRWDFYPEGDGTRLRFREQVRTGKEMLNRLAPVFKPAFAWNHEDMMRQGERGLRAALHGARRAGAAALTPGPSPVTTGEGSQTSGVASPSASR